MLKPSFIQLNETRFASIASTTVSTVHTDGLDGASTGTFGTYSQRRAMCDVRYTPVSVRR